VDGRLAPSPRLPEASTTEAQTTEAQEATMHHHNIALALAEAHVADLQRAAAHNTSTASPRRRHRLRALALGLGAIAVLAPAALAQPTHDVDTPANTHVDAVHRHHSPAATHPSITFTNPLGRSRGPGAGAGLL
jgi:ferric-dicitrate binding protein FerR (iron transport regulator)